ENCIQAAKRRLEQGETIASPSVPHKRRSEVFDFMKQCFSRGETADEAAETKKKEKFTMATRRERDFKSEEFFTPSSLPENKLATCKMNDELVTSNKLQIVSDKLKTLREKTSISIIHEKSIVNKIRLWRDKYNTPLANRRKCRSSDSSVQRIQEFRSDADKHFDL
ncbi:hypothetical protein PV325_012107, partial [Microctonus aethiopoides]